MYRTITYFSPHYLLCTMFALLPAWMFIHNIFNRTGFQFRTYHQVVEKIEREFTTVPHIEVAACLEVQKVHDHDVILVDVRTAEEISVSVLPSAITLEDFEAHFDTYRSKRVIVYCTIGYRSAMVAEQLTDRGINAQNLRGGIVAWARAGMPLVNSHDQFTRDVHTYGPGWNYVPESYQGVW